MCDKFISLSSEMLMWLVIISGCKVWDLRKTGCNVFSLLTYEKELQKKVVGPPQVKTAKHGGR